MRSLNMCEDCLFLRKEGESHWFCYKIYKKMNKESCEGEGCRFFENYFKIIVDKNNITSLGESNG